MPERGPGGVGGLSEVNRVGGREREVVEVVEGRGGGGVSEVNTMGAVISDSGHLIPRSQRGATGSGYRLLPVCRSALPPRHKLCSSINRKYEPV